MSFTSLAILLWLAANSQFGAAKRIIIPPDPYGLKEVTLQVDTVGTGPRRGNHNGRKQGNYAIWVFSEDYPKIPFELTGTAVGLSIRPPMNITFLVNIDPQLYLNIKYNGIASVITPVRVYGAKIGDVLVADPVVGYDMAVKNKSRKRSIAWLVVCLGFVSASISGFLVWKRFFRS